MPDDLSRSFVRQLIFLAGGLVACAGLTGCPTDEPPQGCEGGECADASIDVTDGCESKNDCPVGEQCVDNQCEPVPGCQNDMECPGDQVCREGYCYDPEPEDTGGGMEDTTDAGPTDTADGGSDAGDTGEGGDGMTDTTTMDGGETADGECMGCMVQVDGGMRCTEGNDREACGRGGETCQTCGEFEECEDGTCQAKSCSPNNCANGCCQDGECKDGTSAMLCGTGGEECSECEGETRCTANQKCESCNGCWTSNDVCKDGDTSDFCGTGGNACTSCDSDEKCEGGQCIEKTCSEMCSNGCCDGAACRSGTSDTACGDNGASCKECGDGYECDFTQECDLDRSSRWDAIAIDGEVPKSDQNSVFFDSRGNPPDPYIKVKVEGATETHEKQSDVVDNDTTPYWHDTTVTDVLASDLMRNNKITFTVMDEDPWYAGGDDEIAKCVGNFEESHFNGWVQWSCTNHENSNNPVKVKYKFKLEVH